jgi:hypothetical protein
MPSTGWIIPCGINAASWRSGHDGRMSFCAAMNAMATVESASRRKWSASWRHWTNDAVRES